MLVLKEQEFPALYRDLDPILRTCGYGIVELSTRKSRDGFHVYLVVHSQNGIGLDDCEKISKLVLPRIEVIEDRRDVQLEVSSPGLGRVLKHAHELSVFRGKRISVLSGSSGTWVQGTILSYENRVLKLETDTNGVIDMGIDSIQKAKLDNA